MLSCKIEAQKNVNILLLNLNLFKSDIYPTDISTPLFKSPERRLF